MGTNSAPQKKRNLEAEPKGSVYQGEPEKLTPNRAAVLAYLQAGKTISQIAATMGVSATYARRVRRELEAAGLYSRRSSAMENKEVPFRGGTLRKAEPRNRYKPIENNSPGHTSKRFHALQWKVPIVSRGPRFRPGVGQRLRSGTFIQVLGDSHLLVSAAPGLSFDASSTDEAVSLALSWLERLLRRVEADLDVGVLKDRRVWELVKCELADTAAPDAGPVHDLRGHHKIYDPVDGKLRISYDKSLGVAEREVHHRSHWYQDDAALDRHLLALASYGDGPTLPQLASVVESFGLVLKSQVEVTSGLLKAMTPPELPPIDPDVGVGYFG